MSVNPGESSSNIITINSDNRTQNANIELVSSNQGNQTTSSANIGVNSGGIIKSGSSSITISVKGTGISAVCVISDKLPHRAGTKVWIQCIHEQFPVKTYSGKKKVVLEVGDPNSGCHIKGRMVDGKLHGEATIFGRNNLEKANVHYVYGVITGSCELYDDEGRLFFSGIAKEGYIFRGSIFDTNGELHCSGVFELGKLTRRIEYDPTIKLWKEINYLGKVVTIADYKEFYRDGVCYDYYNEMIEEVSIWNKESKVFCHKKFAKNKMMEFNKYGIKVYEGGFNNSIQNNYSREGDGCLFDSNEQIIYKGQFWKNSRFGYGTCYQNDQVTYDGFWYFNHSSSFWTKLVCIMSVLGIIAIIVMFSQHMYIVSSISMGVLIVALISLWSYKRYLLKTIPLKPRESRKTSVGSGIMIPFIHPLTTDLVILDNSCKIRKKLNVRKYKWLKSLLIGVNCCRQMKSLELKNMECLESVVLKEGSFTSVADDASRNGQTRFIVENCENLCSISVQDNCFKYAHDFVLNGLDSLQKITIQSNCFQSVPKVTISNLPQLKALSIVKNCFQSTKTLIIRNLSSLESITIGESCFLSSSFDLEEIESLVTLQIDRYSFKNCDTFRIKSLKKLSSFVLKDSCFQYTKTFAIQNLPVLASINVGNNCLSSSSFEIKEFPKLRTIHIGRDSFRNSNLFKVESVENLSSIEIEENCFQSSMFVINNLSSLEKISIGENCFLSSSFEIRDFPMLRTIQIEKNSFKNGNTFRIESVDKLSSIIIKDNCFQSSKFVINNLASLESIIIGENCFLNSSLDLEEIDSLKTIQIEKNSFKNGNSFKISSMRNLSSIVVKENCFQSAQDFTVESSVLFVI